MIQITAHSTGDGDHRYSLPAGLLQAAIDVFECSEQDAGYELARAIPLDVLLTTSRIAMVVGRREAADYLRQRARRP